ncbi:MAG: GvpL/GvpF family gas vesicle protein [Methanosarcina sp.]|nr:GvpL/GvpF family gas vesicle protein [Methanosarcina sp.]MDD3872763.1 GvpL/GvpF family gas vesicle protein [Methanosarcina sp.]MDD4522540.1 GvpL/GvpF family gas vesicle protein [Methanosarcina sp.]
MKAAPENSRYVYCIIESQEETISFGNIGFQGHEVYTLDCKDFCPVVSNEKFKKYEIGNEEEINIHQKVVNEVMKQYSVIPVAYGMVFKNKKLVDVSMRAGKKAIKKAIKIVDNKVELGIKIILPRDTEIDNQKIEQCKTESIERLGKTASHSKSLDLFSSRLLMNTSYLVDKEKVQVFSDEVEKLKLKFTDYKFQYSGPWPPYNFVDIHILSNKKGGFR